MIANLSKKKFMNLVHSPCPTPKNEFLPKSFLYFPQRKSFSIRLSWKTFLHLLKNNQIKTFQMKIFSYTSGKKRISFAYLKKSFYTNNKRSKRLILNIFSIQLCYILEKLSRGFNKLIRVCKWHMTYFLL